MSIDTEQPPASVVAATTITESISPFALTNDHEFPTEPPPAMSADSTLRHALTTTSLGLSVAELDPPPALPGTPSSPFRRCSCLGVFPGRTCTFCFGTKWTKLCSKCEGEGRIDLSVRRGAERSQPCGNCGGKGILPAKFTEINEATRLAEEAVAGEDGQSTIIATDAPDFRRAVRLPGIGVTSTKRTMTVAAKTKERSRLVKRNAKNRAKGSGTAGSRNGNGPVAAGAN